MNLAPLLRSYLASPAPPELGPGPRQGVDGLDSLTGKLNRTFADAEFAGSRADSARALILLWHDHFDAAHTIAQEIETGDGSYVHAILHRREPDCSNAKYWFRRVGRHSSFPELATRVSELLRTKGELDLGKSLIPGGQWDSFAFVDACEDAFKQPSDQPRSLLLREIQRIEFEVLLEHLVQS